jgi:hypothetical protein
LAPVNDAYEFRDLGASGFDKLPALPPIKRRRPTNGNRRNSQDQREDQSGNSRRSSRRNGENDGEDLLSEGGAIQENEVTTYRDFDKRSVPYDDIEGHEVLQHSNLNERGLVEKRLGNDASKDNPVIALDKDVHKQVTKEQRSIDARNQTREQNIRSNTSILRENPGIPNDAVDKVETAALKHNERLRSVEETN